MLTLDFKDFFSLHEQEREEEILSIHGKMEELKKAPGEYLGWIDYTLEEDAEARRAISLGQEFRKYEVLAVVGIGGSFLGAKSFYDALKNRGAEKGCRLLFLGNSLSGHALKEALDELRGADFAVNVISKSGGTLEPGVAFRLVMELLEEKYGEAARERLMVTTDPSGGNLRKLSMEKGYQTLSIPGNVGGRYSVFTPVGLFPLVAAGLDGEGMLEGVREAKAAFDRPSLDNPAYQYALARQRAAEAGKTIEIYTAYDPSLAYYMEWLKQLYGESEGKQGQGIFPVSVINTRDLHSLGQFIQEGRQNHFETILWFQESSGLSFKSLDWDFDSLNLLAGKDVDLINRKAMEGTRKAHKDGGIPNILFEISELTPRSLAYLSYFFMRACGMTCYLLGVEPFDQPGVEAYKREVKKLLTTL